MTSHTRSGTAEPAGGPQGSAVPDDTAQIVELQEEIGQLKEAVTSHAVVDQAIGMMVALGRVTPDQGWAVLRDVSQHTNIKLRNVAELILIWGQKGDLPPDVRATLEDTLDRYGPTQIPGGPPLR
ncbi:ANTAR domain-containing protein [Streptomyces sp. HC44]|uniref:ANTAR domain-containing protein n=1 Tax=Streptomyces scabichelini TaxID=2711217 RepID=A0A6G4V957_9ACTN|nr:ANTAR domain-containing protein [Streptomyces scabichelini]NGO10609.1 ANTAR domain-containing protein [Streptomyces scabichelini]